MACPDKLDENGFESFYCNEIELICEMLSVFEDSYCGSTVGAVKLDVRKFQSVDYINQSLLELLEIMRFRMRKGEDFSMRDFRAIERKIKMESVRARFKNSFLLMTDTTEEIPVLESRIDLF
jgi:hypothetical protein